MLLSDTDHQTWHPGGLCNIWFASETHLNHKSCDIKAVCKRWKKIHCQHRVDVKVKKIIHVWWPHAATDSFTLQRKSLRFASLAICIVKRLSHYSDVIMGAMASQITSLPIVYSTVVQAQINENIKALRHRPLCGEFTGDRWIPRTNGQ